MPTYIWHDNHVARAAVLRTDQSEHCGSCSHYNVSIFLSCRPHQQTSGFYLWIHESSPLDYHSEQSALHQTLDCLSAQCAQSSFRGYHNPQLSHHLTKALWPHRHHGKYQCFQKERSRGTHLVPLSIKATITLMSATYYLILKPYNHD